MDILVVLPLSLKEISDSRHNSAGRCIVQLVVDAVCILFKTRQSERPSCQTRSNAFLKSMKDEIVPSVLQSFVCW